MLGVLASFAAARIAPRTTIRRLVQALESPNEDTSMAAYMALVKLGPRYAQTVLNTCDQPSPKVAQVLGDMGDSSVVPYLEEWAQSEDEAIASEARESVAILHEVEESREASAKSEASVTDVTFTLTVEGNIEQIAIAIDEDELDFGDTGIATRNLSPGYHTLSWDAVGRAPAKFKVDHVPSRPASTECCFGEGDTRVEGQRDIEVS